MPYCSPRPATLRPVASRTEPRAVLLHQKLLSAADVDGAGTEVRDATAEEVVGVTPHPPLTTRHFFAGKGLGQADAVDDVVRQVADDGAVLGPGRRLILGKGAGVDVNRRAAVEDVVPEGGRREGLDVDVLDGSSSGPSRRERPS